MSTKEEESVAEKKEKPLKESVKEKKEKPLKDARTRSGRITRPPRHIEKVIYSSTVELC